MTNIEITTSCYGGASSATTSSGNYGAVVTTDNTTNNNSPGTIITIKADKVTKTAQTSVSFTAYGFDIVGKVFAPNKSVLKNNFMRVVLAIDRGNSILDISGQYFNTYGVLSYYDAILLGSPSYIGHPSGDFTINRGFNCKF